MNQKIVNKFMKQTLSFNYYYNTRQQSINKNKYHTVSYDYKKKNQYSGLGFSKYTLQKNLQNGSVLLYFDFQKRKLSSDTSAQQIVEKLTDLPFIETATNLPKDNCPEFIRTFSESKIVEVAQQILLKIHEATGLPWWASIALTAYMMRTVITLPFSIVQTRNSAKLMLIKPELEEIIKNCKREANHAVSFHGWTESMARIKYRKDVKTEYDKLIVEYNCHPLKSYVLLLIQLPIWFSFSFATRNLSFMIPRDDPISQFAYYEMTVGGFGWIQDLTVNDRYMILPLAYAIMNLAVIEANLMFIDPTALTRLQKIQRIIFRGVSVLLFPIAMFMPTGTLIYWVSSSSFGLFQTFLFRSPRFKRLIGVPIAEGEPKHPYRFFYNNLKSRLRLTSN
ncbi:mitochondrial inner membrane protein COX18-like [Copidosoma floridanum]|uniref:mitochondrial inner membrane protein COX18-like n=1 Tax=Copidosoma floridanum TaxID=29053 RepID=UPI0006C9C154|nr:mitochondrial inner membrane protein COX18-like [Copidosoma floridanum]